ncbi:hypothetical protein BB561_006703 [Smittium simulii]|uniref:Uncharacterized protein n=1 Tax=Smittium simulii TaxID=133385 RepID=A0A2T9Y289_9FUNG|nr:hypothetical protein BB561_006703 [Smittium simulii]
MYTKYLFLVANVHFGNESITLNQSHSGKEYNNEAKGSLKRRSCLPFAAKSAIVSVPLERLLVLIPLLDLEDTASCLLVSQYHFILSLALPSFASLFSTKTLQLCFLSLLYLTIKPFNLNA